VEDPIGPVSKFLRELEEDGSMRLTEIAKRLASRPFDIEKFRQDLRKKLSKHLYSQHSASRQHQKTFLSVLQKKNADVFLLSNPVLEELKECLLLGEIHKQDEQLEKEKRSVVGLHIKFHHKLATELERHERTIERLSSSEKRESQWVSDYLAATRARRRREYRTILMSKHPGSRRELLGGRVSTNLGTQLAIYSTLAHRLRSMRLSKRLLCRLSVLIASDPRASELESEESVYKTVQAPPRS